MLYGVANFLSRLQPSILNDLYDKRMYFKSDPEVNEFFLWFGEMEFCLAQCEFKSHTRYICPLYLKTAMGISIQGIQDQKINFELS